MDALQITTALHATMALAASMHVVLHHPQARGAALWLIVIWLVPWLGPIFYVLIGINRIPRRARGLAQNGAPVHQWSEDNEILPLVGGDEAYGAMLQAIDAARTSVHLTTYIFDHDRAGLMFVQAFARAIERGVTVRVLIDDVGSRYSHPPITRELKRVGVHVAKFMPTRSIWRWPYANLRNHRKLMIVDDDVGFIGGMNIREACMASLQPAFPTLDTHFRVRGAVIEDFSGLFSFDWSFATQEELKLPESVPTSFGKSEMRLVSGGPDRIDEPIRWHKLTLLVRANQRVRIVTPYFVPDEDVMTALSAAASAGVHIQIIMPSVNNLRLVAWASRACWQQLIDRGVEILLAPPPFEHTKIMLIDDDLAIVGSANWDERSFRLNFEADVEIRDASLTRKLDAIIDARVGSTSPQTVEDLATWPLWSRLRDGVARLALPYL